MAIAPERPQKGAESFRKLQSIALQAISNPEMLLTPPQPVSQPRLGFYLDDSLDPAVSAALRGYGVRATRPTEVKLQNQSDATQLLFAYRHQLVFVTAEVTLVKFAGSQKDHGGVVYSPLALPIGRIVRQLLLLYETFQPTELAGKIEILS